MFAPYRPGGFFFLLTRAHENSTIPFFRTTLIFLILFFALTYFLGFSCLGVHLSLSSFFSQMAPVAYPNVWHNIFSVTLGVLVRAIRPDGVKMCVNENEYIYKHIPHS